MYFQSTLSGGGRPRFSVGNLAVINDLYEKITGPKSSGQGELVIEDLRVQQVSEDEASVFLKARGSVPGVDRFGRNIRISGKSHGPRSEAHTSELQSPI